MSYSSHGEVARPTELHLTTSPKKRIVSVLSSAEARGAQRCQGMLATYGLTPSTVKATCTSHASRGAKPGCKASGQERRAAIDMPSTASTTRDSSLASISTSGSRRDGLRERTRFHGSCACGLGHIGSCGMAGSSGSCWRSSSMRLRIFRFSFTRLPALSSAAFCTCRLDSLDVEPTRRLFERRLGHQRVHGPWHPPSQFRDARVVHSAFLCLALSAARTSIRQRHQNRSASSSRAGRSCSDPPGSNGAP
eukprot:CAMPEP_0115834912 /NCGR_PEP_ID=MMETSP0287-20121206/3929_1 /TAXON_ID=412157 /ORGANISM="Chrysochromulina rotalis, Strain UIO044" /LENGTH=249 /DNA_ID=CAMNT_0003288365 /DNA_START=307 /DNA_END=1057 /DNA_ORIENTATION=-